MHYSRYRVPDNPKLQLHHTPLRNLLERCQTLEALGSIGSALRSIDNLKREVEKVRELTKHPFAINFTINTFSEDAFRFAIEEAEPKVVSCALGNPKDLVKKVHDAGLLFNASRTFCKASTRGCRTWRRYNNRTG